VIALKKDDGSRGAYVAKVWEEGGKVTVMKHRVGQSNGPKNVYPAGSMGDKTADAMVETLVASLVAEGFVQTADPDQAQPTKAYALSVTAMGTGDTRAWKDVAGIFTAFGMQAPTELNGRAQRIGESQFTLKRTINGVTISANLQLDPASQQDMATLDRHLIALVAVSLSASLVIGDTNETVDVHAHLRSRLLALPEELMEPLYVAGVFQRPINLARAFGDGPGSYSVGF